MGNWKTWLFVIVLYLMVRQCGGCGGNKNERNAAEIENHEVGTWTCEKCHRTLPKTRGNEGRTVYGQKLCPSCYGDYKRWEPAVEQARKKFYHL